MAFTHGKNALFKTGTGGVDPASKTLFDWSPYLDSVSFPRSMDTAETTTFGASARSYIPSFPSNTFSVSGKWDGATSAADEKISTLFGIAYAVQMQYRPNGTATPSYDMVGNTVAEGTTNAGVFLSSYAVSSPVNDVVSFTADLVGNKAVTRS